MYKDSYDINFSNAIFYLGDYITAKNPRIKLKVWVNSKMACYKKHCLLPQSMFFFAEANELKSPVIDGSAQLRAPWNEKSSSWILCRFYSASGGFIILYYIFYQGVNW